MPQINKVEREHDIKLVSRTEELKPAKEKFVAKAKPQLQTKRQIKENSEITEKNRSVPLNTPLKAARRTSVSAMRHAKLFLIVPINLKIRKQSINWKLPLVTLRQIQLM